MSQPRDNWSSSAGLVLAATGSAIGLGNLWKFPFITWQNNGGAFVLVYLICIVAVGLPIMMAELLIGRRSQKSAVGALKEAAGPWWGIVGGWGVLAGFILLSYYTVIAGWSLYYFAQSIGWSFGGYPAGMAAGDLFNEQVGNAGLQLMLSLGFSIATIAVVYFGVSKGIERIARIFLPILFAHPAPPSGERAGDERVGRGAALHLPRQLRGAGNERRSRGARALLLHPLPRDGGDDHLRFLHLPQAVDREGVGGDRGARHADRARGDGDHVLRHLLGGGDERPGERLAGRACSSSRCPSCSTPRCRSASCWGRCSTCWWRWRR